MKYLINLVRIVVLLLLVKQIYSCEKEPTMAPSLTTEDSTIFIPDTIHGESWHYLSAWEVREHNGDTVMIFQRFGRPTWRWQNDGYPVVEPRDTTYHPYIENQPEWHWVLFEFKHGYPYAD